MKVILRNRFFDAFTIFLCSMIFSCASTAQRTSAIPDWISYETINQEFPEKDFIARIGSGENPNLAQLKADAELSSYFNQNITSITQAQEKYLNENNSTTSQKALNRTITITTNSELIGLKHTDCFFNKKESLYYTCSYLNRNEAWFLIEPKLKSYSTNFENSIQGVDNESEIFNKIILQNKALQESEDFYKLYYLAYCITPEKAKKYSHYTTEIQKLSYENFELKSKIKIYTISNGDSSNRIKIKTEELLSNEGFIISQSKASYIATINLNTEVEKSKDIYLAYPQIKISIEKSDGTALATYSKQLGKISAYTKETTERLALNKLETELENNLINNLLYKKRSE